MSNFATKFFAQMQRSVLIGPWLLLVFLVLVDIGPSSVGMRPKLSGAVISENLPPGLEGPWTGSFEPGNVDVVSTENGKTAISGWIGPSTEGLWILAEFGSSLSFEPFNRPDVEQVLGWSSGQAYGYSFSISQVNVTCIWHLGNGIASLRYSMAGARCED